MPISHGTKHNWGRYVIIKYNAFLNAIYERKYIIYVYNLLLFTIIENSLYRKLHLY